MCHTFAAPAAKCGGSYVRNGRHTLRLRREGVAHQCLISGGFAQFILVMSVFQ